MDNYRKQVDKQHYSFGSYYYPGRWMSYWHEVDQILNLSKVSSVLDVGPGSNLLKNVLATFRPELQYRTVDIAKDIEPDYVGPVTALPLEENSHDAVCAFQVLEHIEYKDVPRALQELKRVSSQYVLISVPHSGTPISFHMRLPLLPPLRLAWMIPRPRKHVFAGQHYWELGKRGFSVRTFRSLLQEHFTILDEFSPFENQYHRFFILKI